MFLTIKRDSDRIDIVINNLREVLKDDSGGAEGNLDVLLGGFGPIEDLFHVMLLHGEVVAITDSGLEQDTDGVGQLLDARVTEGWQLVEVMLLAVVLNGGLDGLVKGIGLGGEGSRWEGGLLSVVDKFLHILVVV